MAGFTSLLDLKMRLVLERLSEREPGGSRPDDFLVARITKTRLINTRRLPSFRRAMIRILGRLHSEGLAARLGDGWHITEEGRRWLKD